MIDKLATSIQTFTGKMFCPLDPDVDSIDIEDIANGLSMQVRFAGQCKEFYSVAQHSVLVSRQCPPEAALWGLLHDASEAYIADICRPIKPHLVNYYNIEARLMAAICTKFDLPPEMPPGVKQADNLLLYYEAHNFMSPLAAHWSFGDDLVGLEVPRIFAWGHKKARKRFYERFEELTKCRK
jgi:uncharacterized protein